MLQFVFWMYLFGCSWWTIRSTHALVKELGPAVWGTLPFMAMLSIAWPVIRCRPESEDDLWIDRIFA